MGDGLRLDNLGFNVYRDTTPDGPGVKLNSHLITTPAPGSPNPQSYSYQDSAGLVAGKTYYYWLEDVSLGGGTTRHGPVSVTYDGPTAVTLASRPPPRRRALGAGAGAAHAARAVRPPHAAPRVAQLVGAVPCACPENHRGFAGWTRIPAFFMRRHAGMKNCSENGTRTAQTRQTTQTTRMKSSPVRVVRCTGYSAVAANPA